MLLNLDDCEKLLFSIPLYYYGNCLRIKLKRGDIISACFCEKLNWNFYWE